jgi:4-amino-4-deoxy-L-arabinose transferase-like glycosyltransferase
VVTPRWTLVGGLVMLLAFGFLGTRGLWEPDEGRYVAVARDMTLAGDYVTPTLGQVPHFTKPPLTYWMVAAGLRLTGMTEWGARVGHGLAFAATALLVALLGERLAGSPRGRWAGVVYATMLLPFVAGSVITPDTLLTLCQTWALLCFWSGWAASAPSRARDWMLSFWAGLGAAFLTKGPPALLPLAVVLPFALLARPPASGLTRALWLRPAGVAVFLTLALPWFLLVAVRHPGLVEYFLRDEVAARIVTSVHHRNSRWFMGLLLYPLTAFVGTLPWSLAWRPPAPPRGIVHPWEWLRADERRLFLGLWIAVPSILLTLARSRLPLYLLPIFPALALVLSRRFVGAHRGRAAAWLTVWIAGLLGLRLLGAWYPAPQDTRALASWIRGHIDPGRTEVVVVDQRIYGLPVYLDVPVELMSRIKQPPAYRPTTDGWDEEIAELGQAPYRHLYLVRGRTLSVLEQRIERRPVVCQKVIGRHDYHLLVCDHPTQAAARGGQTTCQIDPAGGKGAILRANQPAPRR